MWKRAVLFYMLVFLLAVFGFLVGPLLFSLVLFLGLLCLLTRTHTQKTGEIRYSLPLTRKVFNAANMLANGHLKAALRQLEGVPDAVSVDGVTAGQLRKRIREQLPTEG